VGLIVPWFLYVARGCRSVFSLQYVDDDIFFCEPSVHNLWTLNTILRSFKHASSLNVNFLKSSVVG
jgi:hypothetical protein